MESLSRSNPRRIRILRSGSIEIGDIETKDDECGDRMLPTERRAMRNESGNSWGNKHDSTSIYRPKYNEPHSNGRRSALGTRGGLSAMYWESVKHPATSPTYDVPKSRRARAASNVSSISGTKSDWSQASEANYYRFSARHDEERHVPQQPQLDNNDNRGDCRSTYTRSTFEPVEQHRRKYSMNSDFTDSEWNLVRERGETFHSFDEAQSRASIKSRKLSASELVSRAGTASIGYNKDYESAIDLGTTKRTENQQGIGQVIDLEASRQFLKAAKDEDLEKRLGELREELQEMKRLQNETEETFHRVRSNTVESKDSSVRLPTKAASYHPVWRRSSVDSALSGHSLPIGARSLPVRNSTEDVLNPASLVESRLLQLETEEKLVVEQLKKLDEQSMERSMRIDLENTLSTWPIAVQGEPEIANRINGHVRPLVEQYASLIRQLQRGAVMLMVMERSPDRSKRHTVVEVEVKITEQLERLEWSPLKLHPRKRYAVQLKNVVAIMCGSSSEAAQMGCPVECLFRLHLASVPGMPQPPPLQLSASSAEQRHCWVLGLSLFHSMRNLAGGSV